MVPSFTLIYTIYICQMHATPDKHILPLPSFCMEKQEQTERQWRRENEVKGKRGSAKFATRKKRGEKCNFEGRKKF